MESVDERSRMPRVEALAPVLFSRSDNTWVFEHPHAVGPNGSLQVNLYEQDVDALTDVFVAFLGEAINGMSLKDVRAAIALGLYPLMERARN